MLKLILCRLLQGVLVLLITSLLVFGLLAAAGGDVVSASHSGNLSHETIEAQRRIYGLDRPLYERYSLWVSHAAQGDFGHSYYFGVTVWSLIQQRISHTAALAVAALGIAWAVSLTLGIASARSPGSWVDRLSSGVILLAASTPKIALALLALTLVASTRLLGAAGLPNGDADEIWSFRVLPPAIVLSIPFIAIFLAQTRGVIREALKEDFARAARAKGASEAAIVFRHALRPALSPLITIFGYSLGGVMSGSVVVERVMNWRGIGALSVDAVNNRDIPLVLGVTMVAAAAVLLGNLAADVLSRLNNPRLR
jgi:peptide/nickel transport system permease protein